MKDRPIFYYTFILSGAIHVVVLGLAGGLFRVQSAALLPETQVVELNEKYKTPLLPEIRIIGEFKQFPRAASPRKQDASLNKNAFTQAIETGDADAGQTDNSGEKAMLRYQDTVKQAIESNRYYPMRAQRMRLEGVVELAFAINANGSSRNIRVIKSSGSKFLDAQAMDTIGKSSPFRPLPKEIAKSSVDIRVAVVFSL